jgi:hypothetical protein
VINNNAPGLPPDLEDVLAHDPLLPTA